MLQTIPGVGPIISMTILLEIDTITRFDSRQQFCSYARLISPRQESDGKVVGVGNARAGNARIRLKWAFSEAAVLSSQKDERMKKCLAKLQSKHGTGKGLSIFGGTSWGGGSCTTCCARKRCSTSRASCAVEAPPNGGIGEPGPNGTHTRQPE